MDTKDDAAISDVLDAFVGQLARDLSEERHREMFSRLDLANTRGSEEQESRRVYMAVDWLYREVLPDRLDTAGQYDFARALRARPEIIKEAGVTSTKLEVQRRGYWLHMNGVAPELSNWINYYVAYPPQDVDALIDPLDTMAAAWVALAIAHSEFPIMHLEGAMKLVARMVEVTARVL